MLNMPYEPWRDTSEPGVRFKTPNVDLHGNLKTALFEVEAGVPMCWHSHSEAEGVYIFSDAIEDSGVIYEAGNYSIRRSQFTIQQTVWFS